MTLFWDIDGVRLPGVLHWAFLFEDNSYRIVAISEWADGLRVSCVWMGFNAEVFMSRTDEPTSIFSTAILDREGVILERHAPTREIAIDDFGELMEEATTVRRST